MNVFWYVGLEAVNGRYTERLCGKWFPEAFAEMQAKAPGQWLFEPVPVPAVDREISVGRVLDATGRGVVSLAQVSYLLQNLHRITSDDVIYFQDFWTPGIEALLYALHQCGKNPRIYARNFAQSVDEYDFTYPMRSWMRPVELGWASALSGMFVASEVHRQQLRAAGYSCPIHVTGLPFSLYEPGEDQREVEFVDKRVMFTSRMDAEKNPWFMLEVARAFLHRHKDWEWLCTTSAAEFRTSLKGLKSAMLDLTKDTGGRFQTRAGVLTEEYLSLLRQSRIQFNSSLQDYVAFTMLEAVHSGCDLCYPGYRSFPECVPARNLYRPFDVGSALRTLERLLLEYVPEAPRDRKRAPVVCHMGLRVEVGIMLDNFNREEVNVWHQPATYFRAEGLLP